MLLSRAVHVYRAIGRMKTRSHCADLAKVHPGIP